MKNVWIKLVTWGCGAVLFACTVAGMLHIHSLFVR